MARYKRCAFIWLLVSSDLRLLIKERLIFSKTVKIADFPTLSGWIEKYEPALSKSDSSLYNSYCMKLELISLAVNVARLNAAPH